MKKVFQILFLTLAGLLLAVLGVLTVCFSRTAPNEYDPWENRALADTPVLSRASVLDGSYFTDTESYLSDHLYGRTALLRANVQLQQTVLCPSVNGVVQTENVLLLDNGIFDAGTADYAAAAETAAARLAAIRDVAEANGGTFLFVGLPTQRAVFSAAYPKYMNNDSVRTERILSYFVPASDAQGLTPFFLSDTVMNSGLPLTELYSPVDHHFTLKGAQLCCEAVIERLNALGCEIPSLPDDLTLVPLLNPMLGTYNRKLYGCSTVSDQLLTYRTDDAPAYERWDNGTKTDAPLIVLPQTETEFVQYTAYMGGDKAETVIQTHRPSMKKLLIVGDSFTNAMETLLYMSFDEMRSLDYRYYTEKTLSEYISDYQPDVVLVIRDSSVYLSLDGNGDLK